MINELIYIEVSVRGINPAKLNFAITAVIVDHTLYDLLIGMPTIQAYNLLPVLQAHLAALPQLCSICTNSSFANTTVNAYASSTGSDHPHITEIFDDEEDYDLEDTPDISDMLHHDSAEIPQHIEGPPNLQHDIRTLCFEYKHIFSTTLRTDPARVPPLQFEYDSSSWQRPPNKLPARGLSVDKQLALSDLVNNNY
jgi:hypothetical protein